MHKDIGCMVQEKEKEQNSKDYINPRPVVPQRLKLNTHRVYTCMVHEPQSAQGIKQEEDDENYGS